MTSAHDIEQILRGVRDPELGSDIVDLGMFKGAEIEGGKATVRIALTIAACPMRSQIETEVKSKVASLPGIDSVSIEIAEMDQAERSKLMEKARRMAHDNPPPTRVPATTRVIAIASGKGGVGKSSLAVNIATAIASSGMVVGLLDADIWGFSVPRMLGLSGRLSGEEGLIEPNTRDAGKGTLKVVSMGFLVDAEEQALMWRGLVLSRAVEQFLSDVRWGELDYLVIDMPPGTGDVQMALSRLLPQAELIVVTTPQRAAEKVAVRVANMARRSFLKVAGVIENMSEFICEHGSRYQLFGSGGGAALAGDLGVPLIGKIPLDSAILEGGDIGEPAVLAAPESAAAQAICAIADLIMEEIAPPLQMESCSARILRIAEEAAATPRA